MSSVFTLASILKDSNYSFRAKKGIWLYDKLNNGFSVYLQKGEYYDEVCE